MRQWTTLFRKEMLEMGRNGKWIWVPIVSVLLMVMTPVSAYYMPQILDMAGNLPEGAVIEIPQPQAPEVMAQALSQFGTMGVLILVLSSMGIVAAERSSGTAAMIMARPVSHTAFITAKWAALLTLAACSFTAGYGAAWYYTGLLFGSVELFPGAAGLAAYGLWLALIVTLVLLMSVWLRKSGAAAFISLFAIASAHLLSGLFKRYSDWTPGRLADHAAFLITDGSMPDSFVWSALTTLLLIALMLVSSILLFRRQQFPE